MPRVDITAPANAIEYHPALLAHAEEGGSGGGGGSSAANGPGVMHINPSHISSSTTFPMMARMFPAPFSDSESDSDLSDLSDSDLSDDSLDSIDLDLENLGDLSPAEQAENELFGLEYNGPTLSDDEASRLLVLMAHSSTCPGRYVLHRVGIMFMMVLAFFIQLLPFFYRHKHAKHRDVCSSVKYLMLHVRDCPGTTAAFDICPFPWCRKVKHLLYHMVSCVQPKDCAICSPQNLSPNLTALIGLNDYRRKKQRERRAAAMAAAAAAAKAKPPPARAMPKSAKATAIPKAGYRPTAAKPKAASAAFASSVPSAHRHYQGSAPSKNSGTASVSSKTTIASAAAVAAAPGAALAVVPQAKPSLKPTPQLSAGMRAATKPTPTPAVQQPRSALPAKAPATLPTSAATTIKVATNSSESAAQPAVPNSVTGIVKQKPPTAVTQAAAISLQKVTHAVAAEVAKLQTDTAEIGTQAFAVGTNLPATNTSTNDVVATLGAPAIVVSNPAQPTSSTTSAQHETVDVKAELGAAMEASTGAVMQSTVSKQRSSQCERP